VLQGVVISSKLDHFDTSFENLIFHLNNFPFSRNLSEILNLSSDFRSLIQLKYKFWYQNFEIQYCKYYYDLCLYKRAIKPNARLILQTSRGKKEIALHAPLQFWQPDEGWKPTFPISQIKILQILAKIVNFSSTFHSKSVF